MSHKSRPYQVTAVANVIEAFQAHTSAMVVMPTASGKSIVTTELVNYFRPKRSLILAHRGELLFQAARHVQRTGLETSIEKAELYASTSLFSQSPVVVASVPTLVSKMGNGKRMEKFKPTDFGLIVCEENHHFVAKSFRSILDYFKKGNPNIKIFGSTATPDRSDEEALGQVFEVCAFRYDILDAIQDGWLVPVYTLGLRVEGMDFSHIRTTAGELNSADLAAVMEAEKPLYGIAQGALEAAYYLEPNALHGVPVEQWSQHLIDLQTPPRSTLCFTVSVRHSEMLSDIFNRVVPGIAGWICGETREAERLDINNRFKNGDLPILCNCGTHTEGVDVPRAEVIVPKPTKSRSLLTQMIGRGFRPAEAGGRSIVDQYGTAEERRAAIQSSRKPRCLVLDNYGVCGRHKLVTPADILGGKFSEEVVKLAVEKAREKCQPVNMTEEMIEAEEELRKKLEEGRRRLAARRSRLVGKIKFNVREVNLFDIGDMAAMKTVQRQTGKPLSEKQRAVITAMGKDPDRIPIGYAKKLIGERFKQWRKK